MLLSEITLFELKNNLLKPIFGHFSLIVMYMIVWNIFRFFLSPINPQSEDGYYERIWHIWRGMPSDHVTALPLL